MEESGCNIGFILQARMGSERLPDKVLLPFFKGKSVLELLIDRIRANFDSMQIIIATSSRSKDDVLAEAAKKKGVQCIRGSEKNVLSRFLKACSVYELDYTFRVCCDNPFLDVKSFHRLKTAINENYSHDLDYVSYKVNETPAIKTHFGFWGELASCKALKKVSEHTSEKQYVEHVTNYIYEHPELFNLKWLEVPDIVSERDGIRLTMDTKTDYKMLSVLYRELRNNKVALESEPIVEYLADKTQFLEKMEVEILKNNK